MSGLQLVIDMARDKRDVLALRVSAARQTWMAAQLQLDQLESYAQETTARWGAHASRAVPEIIRHHYQFMDRLHHAMNLQSGIVAEHAATVSREAGLLRAAEARLESVRLLQSQREAEGRRIQARSEQKLTDEQASQLHLRSAANRLSGDL